MKTRIFLSNLLLASLFLLTTNSSLAQINGVNLLAPINPLNGLSGPMPTLWLRHNGLNPIAGTNVSFSQQNIRLDWDPSLPEINRYSSIAFNDPNNGSADERNFLLEAHGSTHPNEPKSMSLYSLNGWGKFNLYYTQMNIRANNGALSLKIDQSSSFNPQQYYTDFQVLDPSIPGTERAFLFRTYSIANPTYSNKSIMEIMGGIEEGITDPRILFRGGNGNNIKVGINLSSPEVDPGDYSLYVGGGIMTDEIKVAVPGTSDWSDYVFDEDYELMPLSLVKDYIIRNKHLPEVPSAEEVVSSGVDIIKMDATLLKKIEELTLYMISLEESNSLLKKKIAQLENQLK